jgi:alkylation response protein AidB-like acyl-CoA dehydrogenase
MAHESVPLDDLRARFSPLFQQIAAAARAREAARRLPYEEVRSLKEAGFGALRLATADGGSGASLEQFFQLLVELGAADSNFPQIWRNHIAFVEDHRAGEAGKRWRNEIADRKMFGGAWTERGGDSPGDTKTTVTPAHGGYRLNGTKHYSTGSIYADWVHVTAKLGTAEEERHLAIVRADAPGVRLLDDWTGVGQRLSGSGTAEFSDVWVPETHLYPFKARAPYQQVVYQLVHLATLAGIARAAHNDVVAALRSRNGSSRVGPQRVPREEPLYQEVVGRVGALASSAEASVLWAARRVEPAANARLDGASPDEVTALARHAAVAVYEAQLTVTEAALTASTLLFDALGGSALDQSTLLDRHWRNARTISSHNPRVFKARMLGDFHLNGADPLGRKNEEKSMDQPAATESERPDVGLRQDATIN